MKRKIDERPRQRSFADPTPEQIRERCAEIRKGWDDRTHRIRAGQARELVDSMRNWRVPEYNLRELANTLDDEPKGNRAA